ncbi:MAG: prepilin-type N-terminal cleavage/methylation domain-containing protein [Oscillospiraceae bacterium]|nr:prepilin-type N-terminal cleavage/methylation domain-containing protein [Clostridia bacterium]MBO5640441.1 prepilin-type N-terminal cleavage/methylation domain-containing protein [Oscillospiraceae bacterium]
MQKKRNNRGFSLAELLIVAAIIVVLSAVAFVAVQSHQRSMTQLEYDTIAKEIFVAAQNHLTAAESQGYPGLSPKIDDRKQGQKYGTPDSTFSLAADEVYYLVYPNPGAAVDMLELMLPFGAIDETIRAGGSYLIRYQPSSARVLDVFYSNKGHTAWLTTKGTELSIGAFGDLMTNCRKTGDKAYNSAVVGWYGDGDALPVGTRLEAPQVLIHNEETLYVEVNDTNRADTSLVLIITGETSGAKKAFYLRNGTTVSNGNRISELNVVLDDITQSGFHFGEIEAESSTPPFIPGENITIEAVAYNNSELTNVAYSGKGRTNSIFADPSSYVPKQTDTSSGSQVTKTDDLKINGTIVDETSGTAAVANFRHLENLDRIVSHWGKDLKEKNPKEIKFTAAIQLTNLSDSASDEFSWTSFVEKTHESIITLEKGQTDSKNYLPVYLENGFDYFGRNHSISDVKANGKLTGDSQRNAVGVFGELNGGRVSDLMILDSTISSSASAGGLIGSMSGTTVEKCAANGIVSSSGVAGGLIGTASSGKVTFCYSAGHTKDGSYEKWIEEKDSSNNPHGYDVTGATAGGLIGSSSAAIRDSYSTCSVSGTGFAGGFVGNADGGSITNCYAVGLVETELAAAKDDHATNNTIGAFAGKLSATPSGCLYYSIINEVNRIDTDKKMFDHYLGAVGDADNDNITEIDLNAQSYESFVGEPGAWTKAEPNDEALGTYYQNKYNLKGISRLAGTTETQTGGTTDATEPIVYTHYGDWPAPEIFVINN